MIHHASSRFWSAYEALPPNIRNAADKSYALLKQDPRHPSLHFKRIGHFWSVRVGIHHRALGMDVDGGDVLWIWIGSHSDYDRLIKTTR